MKLSETTYDNSETGCCARLDESRWDGQTFTWNNKPFLKDHIREFLHIPLNYGSVITRDHAAIEAAEAYPAEPLWLTEEVSPWGAEVFGVDPFFRTDLKAMPQQPVVCKTQTVEG